MPIPYEPRVLDYQPNPLSRLRRQLSQRESQGGGLSAAVYLIEAGFASLKRPRCCGDFCRLPVFDNLASPLGRGG